MGCTFAPASARPRETSRPIPRAPPALHVRHITSVLDIFHTCNDRDFPTQVKSLSDVLVLRLREDHFVV